MSKEAMKLVANNKKAYHDFFIDEKYEAGIALHGTEVKSLRMGKCSIKEAFVRIENGEAFIYGMNVSPYEKGNIFNKDPLRVKKLLLHKAEIGKLAGNSADAAAKIRQVSAEVIQAVDELAEGSQQMIEFVRNSTEEGFGGLVATSENYATDANAMRAMMEQFAQTAEELRSTMDGIRESISAVNIAVEESAKGIAGVSESSVQLTGNVNDIQSEASDNNGIAEDLATEVGKFKLE